MTTLVDIIRTWWPMFCFVQDKMTASTDRGMQIRPWEVSWLPFHNCPLANISAIKNMSFLDKLDTDICYLTITVNHEWHSNKSYVTLFDGLSLVTDIDHSSRRDELSYLHTMTLWHTTMTEWRGRQILIWHHVAGEEPEPGIGMCGWLLTAISWFVVIVTLPFSLCVCFKVNQPDLYKQL